MDEMTSYSVLVLDEEPAILALVSAILERNGMRTLRARNPEEALQIAAREYVPIDIVLANVMAPGLDESDLIRRLQELRPQIRVLNTSGLVDRGVLRVAVLSDVHSVDGDLVQAIRTTMQKERARASGRSQL